MRNIQPFRLTSDCRRPFTANFHKDHVPFVKLESDSSMISKPRHDLWYSKAEMAEHCVKRSKESFVFFKKFHLKLLGSSVPLISRCRNFRRISGFRRSFRELSLSEHSTPGTLSWDLFLIVLIPYNPSSKPPNRKPSLSNSLQRIECSLYAWRTHELLMTQDVLTRQPRKVTTPASDFSPFSALQSLFETSETPPICSRCRLRMKNG